MLLGLIYSVMNAAYYVLVRHLNTVLPPFMLGTIYRSEFVILMFSYMVASGRTRELAGTELVRNLRVLLIVAACNFLIESATIFGLRFTTALNGALFSRLDIPFAVVLGILFYGEKLTLRELAALGVLVFGCMGVLSIRLSKLQHHWIGDLLVIAAAGLLASNAFLIRFKLREIRSEVIAFYNVLISTVPFALASLMETRPTQLGTKDTILLVVLGVVEIGFYLAYYAALRTMAVWRVRAMLLTVPALVLLPGVLLLHDPITLGQLGGAALVLLGSLLLIVSGPGIAGTWWNSRTEPENGASPRGAAVVSRTRNDAR